MNGATQSLTKSYSHHRELNRIYKHVRDHGGYIVGERAMGALRIAKLAALALECGLEVQWEYEQEDWMTFAGDPEAEYKRKFESGEWECFVAYVKGDDGTILASLGGIILSMSDADSQLNYEYELLAEAIQTLKSEEIL
jgi:hypothetical protein